MNSEPSAPSNAPTVADLDARGLLAGALRSNPVTHPFAEWQAPSEAEVAALFPDYTVIGFLGRGAMGAVYKAIQEKLDRPVAIKLLPMELANLPDMVARFEHEARMLAKLNHPNIVALHDFGRTQAGNLFIVMEYVEGTDLSHIIREAKSGIKTPEALEIVSQVCDALQYAHARGLVHRDVKPQNILVDTQGRVKIADFGLIKLLGEPSQPLHRTMTGAALGTPEYSAPEQLRGEPVDHRADIYSLGVLFYEMLTGEVPRGAWEPPSKRVSADVRLDDVVRRAMQREPENRYQQCSEVKGAVNAVKSPSPPPMPPPPPSEVKAAEWKQKRGCLPTALILIGILGILSSLGQCSVRSQYWNMQPDVYLPDVILACGLLWIGFCLYFGKNPLGSKKETTIGIAFLAAFAISSTLWPRRIILPEIIPPVPTTPIPPIPQIPPIPARTTQAEAIVRTLRLAEAGKIILEGGPVKKPELEQALRNKQGNSRDALRVEISESTTPSELLEIIEISRRVGIDEITFADPAVTPPSALTPSLLLSEATRIEIADLLQSLSSNKARFSSNEAYSGGEMDLMNIGEWDAVFAGHAAELDRLKALVRKPLPEFQEIETRLNHLKTVLADAKRKLNEPATRRPTGLAKLRAMRLLPPDGGPFADGLTPKQFNVRAAEILKAYQLNEAMPEVAEILQKGRRGQSTTE